MLAEINPFTDAEDNDIVDFLVKRMYCEETGAVKKNVFKTNEDGMWLEMKAFTRSQRPADELKQRVPVLMSKRLFPDTSPTCCPASPRWMCSFDKKCDLIYALGLPIAQLTQVCEEKEHLEVESTPPSSLEANDDLALWKFLYAFFRHSTSGESGIQKWEMLTDGQENAFKSYEEQVSLLHLMPFPLNIKLYLMRELKVHVEQPFLEEERIDHSRVVLRSRDASRQTISEQARKIQACSERNCQISEFENDLLIF
ncbi:unnamed protein product [Caenorhabditis sp. 36 PRJEB53466]|nr:unnamed protein product [Caenorhabditis sp. 36 PRJEB53466]